MKRFVGVVVLTMLAGIAVGAVLDYQRNTLDAGIYPSVWERAGFRTGFAFRNDWAVVKFLVEWFPYEEYRR